MKSYVGKVDVVRVDVQDYTGEFPVLCEPSETYGKGTILLYLNAYQFICIAKNEDCCWATDTVHAFDSFRGKHVVCDPSVSVTLTA